MPTNRLIAAEFRTQEQNMIAKESLSVAKVTPVFVFHSLNTGRGGLTKAVMTRANTLADHFGHVHIFTFFYQRKHQEIIQKLYDLGKLDRRVEVHNLYTDLNPFKSGLKLTHPNVDESDLVQVEDSDAPTPSYRFYKNGVYKKYKRFDKNKKLIFIEYFNEGGNRTHCEEYDEQENIVRIRNFDDHTDKPHLDRYVDENGKCYLTVQLDPEKGTEGRCRLFSPKPKTFENPNDLCAYWINQQISDFESPVLMADSRHSYEMLLKIRSADRVVILHNNHYKSGRLRPALEPLFNSIREYDGVVLLTNEQKADVTKEFGALDNCFVIPHAASEPAADPEEKVHYHPHLAVTLARLEPQKRLDEAISAFRYVVKKIPKARYEIYGAGSQKEKLRKLIHKLGLQDNVKLMGHTSQPALQYRKAACTILTSDYEGSPLVLYEAFTEGTPAVTYKMKYGPKDIIRDGLDGFLVEKGNQKRLAAKIVQIMKKKKLREKMSACTVEVMERFSRQKYEDNWVNLVTMLGSRDTDNETNKREYL